MFNKKLLLTLTILFSLLLMGCQKNRTVYSDTGFYFDTVITVTLYENGSSEILDECMDLALNYENLLSATIEGSDIWNLNHNAGSYVTLDPETISLLQTALTYAELSDGVVDPTVGSLSALWNFGSDGSNIVPETSHIEESLSHVDYHSLSLKGNQGILLDSQASVDLGFIAKGYIGDKMKEFLISQGVTSALINLGGNVVTIGSKPNGDCFRVGIQDPFEKSGTPALVVELTDTCAVSAGNYERYFEKDGIRYHHILSTTDGYPARSGLSQVTIISPDSTRADALSTLCFILGYEKAASLIENYPEDQAIFITEDGEILYTDNAIISGK